MLIMQNETEIFISWLIKYIKDDKKITGKKLADLVHCDPTTISSYIRRRTKPDFDMRSKILKAVEVDYDEIIKPIDKDTFVPPTNEFQKKKNELHHEIIDSFQNQDLAVELNRLLIDIEKKGGADALIMAKGALLTLAGQIQALAPDLKTGTGKNG